MKISEEHLEEFRKAYEKEFNEEITREQAFQKFTRLTNFLRAIMKPSSREPVPQEPAPQPSQELVPVSSPGSTVQGKELCQGEKVRTPLGFK
jgi:hypothetical protein